MNSIRNTAFSMTIVMVAAILVSVGGAGAQVVSKCDPGDGECLKRELQTEGSVSPETRTAYKVEKFIYYAPPDGLTKADRSFRKLAKPGRAERGQGTADEAQELAKKLSNPVAALISFPIQSNFDFGMGPDGDGFRYTLNLQPVIPIALNKEWNLISRTIVPIIGQTDVVAPGTSEFGLGDITQAFFFSPNKSEPFVWGLGPQALIPTATNHSLGTGKVGIGPTGLILKQKGPWTVGALVGHIWGVAGSGSRPDVSISNIQPFLAYTTKTAWTYSFNTESTYDWTSRTWSVPIHATVAKLVRFGKQPVSIGGGLRCWANSGPTGPTGCGFRIVVTPLFPKK